MQFLKLDLKKMAKLQDALEELLKGLSFGEFQGARCLIKGARVLRPSVANHSPNTKEMMRTVRSPVQQLQGFLTKTVPITVYSLSNVYAHAVIDSQVEIAYIKSRNINEEQRLYETGCITQTIMGTALEDWGFKPKK